MNNIAPKLQKCWTHKIALKIISKMLKQPNFFRSQPSTLPKKHPQSFTFLRLDKFCSPIRSLTSYPYLINKIGSCNLKTRKKKNNFYHMWLMNRSERKKDQSAKLWQNTDQKQSNRNKIWLEDFNHVH